MLVHVCPKAVFRIKTTSSNGSAMATQHNNVNGVELSPDEEADARDRAESDVYFAAYENERDYSIMNTTVPVLRRRATLTASDWSSERLVVAQPDKCTPLSCSACQKATEVDVEDLAGRHAVSVFVPRDRYTFFLRCNEKRAASDMLLDALQSLTDDVYVRMHATLQGQLLL